MTTEQIKEEIKLIKELLELRKQLQETNKTKNTKGELTITNVISPPVFGATWPSSSFMWEGIAKPNYTECSGPCECEPN